MTHQMPAGPVISANGQDLLRRIDMENCADADTAAGMGVDWRPPEQRIRDDVFQQRMEARKRMQALWDGLIKLYAILMDYVGYVVITSISLAAAITIYNALWPQLTAWAMFTTASLYVVLMMLQILRHNRQQQEWSVQEIGDRIDCIDDAVSELRNLVERNYV